MATENAISPELLRVEDLRVHFATDRGEVRAVDGVSFALDARQSLALVGESGCGKSMTAFSLLRLVPSPPGRIAGGRILFRGEDLLAKKEREMRAFRGAGIAIVFQEPMTSLDPVFTAGQQVMEAVRAHRRVSGREARAEAARLLAAVGIPEPERRLDSYPHELSGGMRQRVMIAIALAGRPALLVADEPTTALDVTIQAQILALIRDLQQQTGMALLLITHNLGIVAEMCDRVAVMYAGRIVEQAATADLLREPLHPYTQGLLRAVPTLEQAPRTPLPAIPGSVPDPAALPAGCRFRGRCTRAVAACAEWEPQLLEVAPGRQVACLVLEHDGERE